MSSLHTDLEYHFWTFDFDSKGLVLEIPRTDLLTLIDLLPKSILVIESEWVQLESKFLTKLFLHYLILESPTFSVIC